MKKIIYFLSFLSCSLAIFSCDQDIDAAFERKDGLHFKHFTVDYNGKRIYKDSTVYSFGLKNDTILIDTLKMVIELVGKPSDVDRKYLVEIMNDSTTAVEGVHYKHFEKEQIFRAKKRVDTLRIPIIREKLNKDYLNPKNERLDLKIIENDDFTTGITRGVRAKVVMNDCMVEPIWWEGNFHGSLYYFHPKKWKILISFNDAFENENSCPFDQNGEGRGYISGLSEYLKQEYVYEIIDGKKYRLLMTEMVLVTEE